MNHEKPAFPVNFANDTEWDMEDPFGCNIPPFSNNQYIGITKRDYFAAKAMQALLSSPNCPKLVNEQILAFQSFQFADAMIEESNDD